MSDDTMTVITVIVANDEDESECGSRVIGAYLDRETAIREATDEAHERYNSAFSSAVVRVFMHETTLPKPKPIGISTIIKAELTGEPGEEQPTTIIATVA